MNKKTISAIIISKNVQDKISTCLGSLKWTDEIVVVDTGSDDETISICKKFGCKVFNFNKGSYPDWRNLGFEKARGEFIFYLDTDEIAGNELKEEIQKYISDWPTETACFAIPRKNIIFGKWLKHGGWYPDYVIRLFQKTRLLKWESELHEQPKYNGSLRYLKNPIIHNKEKTLKEMVVKTNKWSEIEARLMYEAKHPQMNIRRFASAMFREFWYRFVKNAAFLDGGEGMIMGIYQIYSRFISYAKLWELQINDKRGFKTDLH